MKQVNKNKYTYIYLTQRSNIVPNSLGNTKIHYFFLEVQCTVNNSTETTNPLS